MKRILLPILMFASLNSNAQSMTANTTAVHADGTTKSNLGSILENKKFEDSQTLTDAKLKADAGSLSRYSLRSTLAYYGPTLNDFGAKDQPNPDGSPGNYKTALSGSLGLRIRTSSDHTISMGTGLKAIYPFHGMERFDVNDPYLSFDFANRFGGLQMRNSVGGSYVTSPDYIKIGEYGTVDLKNSLVYDLGASGFAIGFETSYGHFLYNRGYEKKDKNAARNNLSFSPNMKYNITDKLNVSSSMNMSFWNPRSVDNQSVMWNRTMTQSLGLGYALKRDVYLSPYLRFYPDRLAADTTTFNFSATLSVL